MASGTAEEIEEERRLLYVAMTRARDSLYVLQPHRFYTGGRGFTDRHVYGPRTRFITDEIAQLFERCAPLHTDVTDSVENLRPPIVDIRSQLKQMWS